MTEQYKKDTLSLILSKMLKESKEENITKGEFWKLPNKYAESIVKLFTIPDVMLPCPFCGSSPELVHQGSYPKSGGNQRTYQVRCTSCEMTDKFWSKNSEAEAIAVWNKRHEA